MLEAHLREAFDHYLITPVVQKVGNRFPPNYISLMAVFAGLLAAFFIYLGAAWPACAFLLLSGYLDVLDGALARSLNQASEWGTVIDIVGDRAVEWLIMLGLWGNAPQMRSGYVIFMLGATLICVTSFLVVGLFSENRGQKSFHYSDGLIERPEAFIFFFLMIVLPSLFGLFAVLFGVLVFYTAFMRLYVFYENTTLKSI